MEYFVVELIGGTVLDFDKKCTNVKYSDNKYCIFTHEDDKELYILALIPHSSIFSIIKESDE